MFEEMGAKVDKWLSRNQIKEAERLQREYEDRIVTGRQIRAFFETDTGKHLKKRMEEDKERVKKEIMKVDPMHCMEVQKLQNEYHVIQKIEVYLAQGIVTGNEAEKALDLKE